MARPYWREYSSSLRDTTAHRQPELLRPLLCYRDSSHRSSPNCHRHNPFRGCFPILAREPRHLQNRERRIGVSPFHCSYSSACPSRDSNCPTGSRSVPNVSICARGAHDSIEPPNHSLERTKDARRTVRNVVKYECLKLVAVRVSLAAQLKAVMLFTIE